MNTLTKLLILFLFPFSVFAGITGSANGDQVSITDASSIQTLDDITIMVWFYPSDLVSGTKMLLDKVNDAETGGWSLFRPNAGNGVNDMTFIHYRPTTNSLVSSSSNWITAGKWYWVCIFDSDGTAPEMWVGDANTIATEVASYSPQTTGSGAASSDASENLFLGDSDEFNQPMDGHLGIVQVFNKRLTTADALTFQFDPRNRDDCVAYYNCWLESTLLLDLSGNQNQGTAQGSIANVNSHAPITIFQAEDDGFFLSSIPASGAKRGQVIMILQH